MLRECPEGRKETLDEEAARQAVHAGADYPELPFTIGGRELWRPGLSRSSYARLVNVPRSTTRKGSDDIGGRLALEIRVLWLERFRLARDCHFKTNCVTDHR